MEESRVRSTFFMEQAQSCRRQAVAYVGQPEGRFLLKTARAFEELATDEAADPDTPEGCHRFNGSSLAMTISHSSAAEGVEV
jgi:hypothetical protein